MKYTGLSALLLSPHIRECSQLLLGGCCGPRRPALRFSFRSPGGGGGEIGRVRACDHYSTVAARHRPSIDLSSHTPHVHRRRPHWPRVSGACPSMSHRKAGRDAGHHLDRHPSCTGHDPQPRPYRKERPPGPRLQTMSSRGKSLRRPAPARQHSPTAPHQSRVRFSHNCDWAIIPRARRCRSN
jgi:hypothetical protein